MNYLYINNQHITTLQGLRECFLQEEAQRLNSSLFNELKNLFLDGDIENFLHAIGEESLAEKVNGIVIGNSDTEIMRQLVTIITGMEPNVNFDFRSCLEVVETTVKGDKAIFKLRVLRWVNEKPVRICIIQPVLLWEALRNNNQDRSRQDKILNKHNLGEWSGRISEAIMTSMGLLALSFVFRDVSLEKYDSDLLRKVSGSLNFKSIDLSQYRQNDIVEFETGINSEYDVWFFIGTEKVGEVSAEAIAYSKYCENYGSSTKYDSERIKLISDNANKGWAQFQNLLGDVYRYGYGVDKSYKDAFSWYSKSAEKGCASAQCSLGEMYLYGKGVDVDYAEALKWFQKSSDQGDAMGQSRLGFVYEKGLGIDANLPKAKELYTMSAMQNNPLGQCRLGRLYETGRGVTKDLDQAMGWYMKSAMQDDALGQIHLGILVENNLRYDKNTDQVNVLPEIRSKYASMGDLFRKYIYHGRNEVLEINDYQWVDWLLRDLYRYVGRNQDAWERYNWNKAGKVDELLPGAILGSALCLMFLGLTSDSVEERVRLLEKAALQDGPFAAYASIAIGLMYENGNGVYKSQSLAKTYYGKAISYFGEELVNNQIRELKR